MAQGKSLTLMDVSYRDVTADLAGMADSATDALIAMDDEAVKAPMYLALIDSLPICRSVFRQITYGRLLCSAQLKR